MSESGPSIGWDEKRVRRLLAQCEGQTEADVVDEAEGAVEIDLSGLPPITPKALSHVHVHVRGGEPVEPKFVIEEVTDPTEIARHKVQRERARRNRDWLQAHWSEIVPEARGKFIAVAGQEVFIADSPEEAWARAKTAHPDDDGAIDQYVRPERGPRIYAY